VRLRRRITFAWALSAVVGMVLSACNGFIGEWTMLDGFSSRFSAVQNGQTREQVIGALGTPARESGAFTLPQRKGYEPLIEQAAQSRASTFLYWDTGSDEVAVVGLTDDALVVFKCRAGK
jgi:hypothetical protein